MSLFFDALLHSTENHCRNGLLQQLNLDVDQATQEGHLQVVKRLLHKGKHEIQKV